MPTPSSHREPSSPPFTSTCPDDQVPFPPSQPSWSQPALPLEHAGTTPQNDISANNLSANDSILAGTGDGAIPTPIDGTGLGSSQRSSPDVSSPSTLSPDPEPSSSDNRRPFVSAEAETEGPLFFHAAEPDDEAKPADTLDQNTGAGGESGGIRSSAAAIESPQAHSTQPANPAHTARRNSGRRARTTRFSVSNTDSWEPYGTRQGIQRQLENEAESAARSSDMPSPSGMDVDKMDEQQVPADIYAWDRYMVVRDYSAVDPTSLRMIPLPMSTYLRPGSRFAGTQQSERQQYDVQVEIKHVDLRESFLCGYLRIQGLTEDHPTLTTYFEGEIIGSKYGFSTKHENWGANDRTDMQHWSKFPAFHPFVRQAKKGNLVIKEYLQRENIFMRWKEHFLVPDHNIKSIHGASFEGFYYICFNQVLGLVHGIYFHSRSEKFQQLELKHINDKGCMSAVEFR